MTDFFAFLSATLGGVCVLMLLWNLNLLVQNIRLRAQLMQRERWHERELKRWRERI